MPKEPSWKKRLTVNQPLTDAELEHCLELFDTPTCKVTRDEDGEYYLTTCRFGKLAEADKVSESATKLITIMKAILKVERDSDFLNSHQNGEGSYSGIFERRGDKWHEYVKVKISHVPNVRVDVLQPTVTVQSFYEDGSPMPSKPQGNLPSREEDPNHWYRCLVCRCDEEINNDLFDTLFYFAQESSWYTLYKAYATIKKAVDGHLKKKDTKNYPSKIIKLKWATTDELDDFTYTANNFDFYVRGAGRHARSESKTSPKRKLIALTQGEELIKRLLVKWLESA